MNQRHDCEASAVERIATFEKPYHFVNSGLPNVYLAGVRYRRCKSCGTQEADIPAPRQLMEAIARAVIQKDSRLTGHEVRFLRKRLQKKQTEFAALIRLTPERLSTIENSTIPAMEEVREKLLRLIFPMLAEDKTLKDEIENRLVEWTASMDGRGHNERILATWQKRKWRVVTEAA